MATKRVDLTKPGEPFFWLRDFTNQTRDLSHYQRSALLDVLIYHWDAGTPPPTLEVWKRICRPMGNWQAKELKELIENYDSLSAVKAMLHNREKSIKTRNVNARNRAGTNLSNMTELNNGSNCKSASVKPSEINESARRTPDERPTNARRTPDFFLLSPSSDSDESSEERERATAAQGVNNSARARVEPARKPLAAAARELTFKTPAAAEMYHALNAVFIGAEERELVAWAERLSSRGLTSAQMIGWRAWLNKRKPQKSANLLALKDTIDDYAREVTEPPLWESSPAVRFVFRACGYQPEQELDAARRQAILNAAENIERMHAAGLSYEQWKANGWTPGAFVKFWSEDESPKDPYPAPDKCAKRFGDFKSWLRGRAGE